MDNEHIRPSRWFYALAGLVFIGGWVGFGVILFKNLSGIESKLRQVVVPGRTEITLPDAGTYTLYYEHKSVVGDKVYSTGPELSGLECRVVSKATGIKVPLRPATMSSNYEFGSRAGTSVFDFSIQDPGAYELSAFYPEGQQGPEVVLAVGHDFSLGLVTTILSSMGIVFGAMAIALTIVVVTFIKRHNAKKRLAASPTPQIYTPGDHP